MINFKSVVQAARDDRSVLRAHQNPSPIDPDQQPDKAPPIEPDRPTPVTPPHPDPYPAPEPEIPPVVPPVAPPQTPPSPGRPVIFGA